MKNIYLGLLCIVCLFSKIEKSFSQQLQLEWEKKITTGFNEASHKDMAIDSEGNVYTFGEYNNSTIMFGDIMLQNVPAETSSINQYARETQSIFLVKYNADGEVLWAKSFGSDRADFANSLVVDTAGNIYITGTYMGTSIAFDTVVLNNTYNHESVFTAKLNTNGNVQWAKSAQGIFQEPIGITGTHKTYAGGIGVTSQGNIFISGKYTESLNFDDITLSSNPYPNGGSTPSFFIIQYDNDGNVISHKQNQAAIGVSGAGHLVIDNQDNIYIAGGYLNGNYSFGEVGLSIDGITMPLYNENSQTSLGFIAKFDSQGNILWINNESNAILSLAHDYNGNIICIPYTQEFNTMEVKKYNAQGNLIWDKVIEGSDSVSSESLATDTGGNIFVTAGYSYSTAILDDIILPNTHIIGESFLVKLNTNAQVQWVTTYLGSMTNALESDSEGNIYMAGELNSPGIFEPFEDIVYGIYTAKLSGDSLPLSDKAQSLNNKGLISVYPNPVGSILNVTTDKDDYIYNTTVYNMLGQAIIDKSYQNQNSITINVSQLQAGYYMLEVAKKSGKSSHKIIKK